MTPEHFTAGCAGNDRRSQIGKQKILAAKRRRKLS